MELDKTILLQKQIKDNSEDLHNEFLDMKHWEAEMKRKDQELLKESSGQPILPPIRNKKNKKSLKQNEVNKQSENNAKSKRIRSYDYSAWEKYDVDNACKEVDKDESDDSTDESISKEQLEKDHVVATKHKEKGNVFVQQQKWAKAVSCYSEAINVFPYDAVFYTNRALCYLKMDNLYSTEADCTSALQLDETYVKAYHRRAKARIGLKQYKEAAQDLQKILKLEPSNKEAKSLLAQVQKNIEKSKPIIISGKDTEEEIPVEQKIGEKMFVSLKTNKEINDIRPEKPDKESNAEKNKKKKSERDPRIPDWLPEKDNVVVVEPISIPAHLRSKKPLTKIPVQEVEFGVTKYSEKKFETSNRKDMTVELRKEIISEEDNTSKAQNEPVKISETVENIINIPPVPKTAVQFLMDWKRSNSTEYRYKYLKQIDPHGMNKVFQDSMESDVLSDIIKILKTEFVKRQESVLQYLVGLTQVKRFRTMIMFISSTDKSDLKKLFEYIECNDTISREDYLKLLHEYEI